MKKLLTAAIATLEWLSRRCFEASVTLEAIAFRLRIKRHEMKRNPNFSKTTATNTKTPSTPGPTISIGLTWNGD